MKPLAADFRRSRRLWPTIERALLVLEIGISALIALAAMGLALRSII
jgi:hypothetical protein